MDLISLTKMTSTQSQVEAFHSFVQCLCTCALALPIAPALFLFFPLFIEQLQPECLSEDDSRSWVDIYIMTCVKQTLESA